MRFHSAPVIRLADAKPVEWTLAELAGAGRLIRDGGIGLRDTGGEVAGAVQGVPLVGEDLTTGVSGACGVSRPVYINMPFKLVKAG